MQLKISPEYKAKLQQATAWISGGTLSVARLSTGFARNKWTSVAIGTAGIGILSNGSYLYVLGVTLGSLSLVPGMINRISSSHVANDQEQLQKTLSTGLSLHLLGIFAIILLSMPFLHEITEWTFGTTEHSAKAVAVLAGLPFAILASSYLESVLFGFNRYDLYIKASIQATLIGALCFIPLFLLYGLSGALWSISVGALVLFLLFLKATLSITSARVLFKPRFNADEAKTLCKFGITLLIRSAASAIAVLMIRREVIARFGAEANGLLQVPIALSAYYSPFLTNALWGRLHTSVARLGDQPEARTELGHSLRANFAIGTICILGILAFQHFLIVIAYSPAFLESANLVRIQLIGDLFHYGWFAFGVYFLGTSKLKSYLCGWVGYDAFWIIFALILMNSLHLGTAAIPFGHLIISAALFFICLAWYIQVNPKNLWIPVVKEFFVCLCLILVQAYLGWQNQLYFLQLIIPIAFLLWRAKSYLKPEDTLTPA